jgi:carbon monoxide dehydrogenase subunit G
MPSASVTFAVKSPPEKVFEFSNDLPSLGSLIPDVTNVEVIDDTTAVWTLVAKVGFVKRTIKMRTTITEFDAPRHAGFRGESDDMDLTGSVDLSPLADGGTTVDCTLDAHGKGPLGKIIDGVLAERLGKEAAGFAENLQQLLEA